MPTANFNRASKRRRGGVRTLGPQAGLALLFAGLLTAVIDHAGAQVPSDTRARIEPGGEDAVVLTAREVTFDDKRKIVTASGNVELTRGTWRLLADRVSFDQTTDRVQASGNVVIVGPDGDTFFAESAEVTGDLKTGLAERLRALLADDARLAAARLQRRDGTINELDNAVFSPCEPCRDGRGNPLWQVRAERVIQNKSIGNITYHNATFELLGVPIAWTPWFQHPDPSVERRSGFLTPTGGSSSALGLTLEVPYHWVLAPNRDVTFSPIFTTRGGVVLGGEWRELREPGETRLAGSITHTEGYSREPGKRADEELRGHVEGRGRYEHGNGYQSGFDLFWTTDNSYLQRYGFGDDDVLENHAFVQRLFGRDYLGLHAYAFQGLREQDEQGRIPVVLPLAQARLKSSRLRWGSHLSLDSSLVALSRSEGLDTRRFSTEVGWHVPSVGRIGDLRQLTLSVRGDAYAYEGDPETFGRKGSHNVEARLIPRATFDWSWPLVGRAGSWQHVLEPVAMATLATERGNDQDIPNEDSQVFEFDETNLFEPSRFPGLDRVDGGAKLAYGLRFESVDPTGLEISGVLGQSYQLRSNDTVPGDSGVSKNFSDFVGRIDFRPGELLDLRYRFRLDRQEFRLRRSDLNVGFGPERLRFDLGWLEVSDEPTGLAPRSREELTAGVRLQVLDSLAIAARTRRDLKENETVSNMFGLLYSDPCLVLIAGLEKRFTRRGELDDETIFKVRISLSNFGSRRADADLPAGRYVTSRGDEW